MGKQCHFKIDTNTWCWYPWYRCWCWYHICWFSNRLRPVVEQAWYQVPPTVTVVSPTRLFGLEPRSQLATNSRAWSPAD